MFPLFVPRKKPEKTMKMSRSQFLMGFAMKHFNDASGWTPSNIATCFSMGFLCLPRPFSWIKLRKLTIWIRLLPSMKKKTPFGSMCCLLSRVGPLGRVGHCPVDTSIRTNKSGRWRGRIRSQCYRRFPYKPKEARSYHGPLEYRATSMKATSYNDYN
jgi:hypothetical protein